LGEGKAKTGIIWNFGWEYISPTNHAINFWEVFTGALFFPILLWRSKEVLKSCAWTSKKLDKSVFGTNRKKRQTNWIPA